MNNPYFSVGEEVMLVSAGNPEKNGDYTIVSINRPKNIYFQTDGGDLFTFGYALGVTVDGDDNWAESALRKKHKPSTDSFTKMMENINELVTQ